jgi:hypothetical protein
MYDTIHLWLPTEKGGSYSPNQATRSLSLLTEHQKQGGEVYFSGILNDTYRVNFSERGVSLKGSLAKYFLNDNFSTLTRSDCSMAFEKMADDLSLPIDQATVTRLDFAQNFLMKNQPEAYYPYLGDCRYYKRLRQPKSVYWANGTKTKLIYDKVAEAKTKRNSIPDIWQGQKVLRYELRYTKRLPKNLKKPEIKADTLSKEKFYVALVDQWISEYEGIQKLNEINLNLNDMKSPKDFIRQLALMKIQEIGQQKTLDLVEELRAKEAFEKKEYYSRLKRDIREICKTPNLTTSNDLITELDKKVRSVKKYYR